LALEEDVSASAILSESLIPAMDCVRKKFTENKIFVPEMLMAAIAMGASLKLLKLYFTTVEIKIKGVFVVGTVSGDLHDIGKNLFAMMVEGSGLEVIDLGIGGKAGLSHIIRKQNYRRWPSDSETRVQLQKCKDDHCIYLQKHF
jgi:methanogenic corrinoid protein MtbC1